MSTGGRILPEAQARRAREFVAGRPPVVPARPASTVVLVRDGAAGLEVYVQRRHTSMAFAGGMIAFPGGRVDAADAADAADAEPGGAAAPGWVSTLDPDPDAARAFVRAALRETVEETGVRLGADGLVPWARWITPRFEPRRYDTWFFLAVLPKGQGAADVSGEAAEAWWTRPATVLERADRGELVMLPPTVAVLTELDGFATTAEALTAGAGRQIRTILPGWVDDGRVVRSLVPGDEGYPGDDPGEDQGEDP
ncbi:hypothetical protein CLV30_104239 [Haloactinopolyspora alba]|uniref:Nudix hydrolase domain-containing protein n=1 Tax=Haloactinopolyspora alba TaxID=648780 RepID=A0A2P8E7C6_9ACTN|nr:NUDIX domain-containing protein [Haloactinopolyspora alba]PSL05369.1 hypothetical protein CLV30_104239 [Haloactinopolyspora alba]